MPQDHTQLEIYNRAYAFALDVYKITYLFPKEETFGITSQLRRAASSIGANISEGCGRRTDKDFIHFLHISMGSIKECVHFLNLSKDLGYIDNNSFALLNEELEAIGKMLTRFTQKITAINY
ncbi:MAG: four helix bundle protein [Candidatus Nanoarchaeia archaeon]|nr:four helix bundle protein [Candidatus Nanoarchaeia archaeon]